MKNSNCTNERQDDSTVILSEPSESTNMLVDTAAPITTNMFLLTTDKIYFTPTEKNVLALDAMKMKKLNIFANKLIAIKKEEDRIKLLFLQVCKTIIN